MSSRKSLGEMLNALLGLNPNLNSSWVQSVSDIVKTLPSQISNQDQDQDQLSILKTKEELAALSSHLHELNLERKQLLNEFLDLKGNIRVFCRIRPMENKNGKRAVTVPDSSNVFLNLENGKSKCYSFDRVFNQASSQDEVFSEIEVVIKSVVDGYNACIFAYGQTGTGKTFTMEGREDDPGVVSRTFKAIFRKAEESKNSLMISLSMVEIYMGCLQDLLAPNSSSCLSIQTNRDGGIEIENLVSIQVNDFHQALRLYRLGCRFRSTASTNSNASSSRSHCMIRIAITCFDTPERRQGMNKIWLVDLGGSERVLKTKASGRRFDEGKAINLSLSALGDVINALQTKRRHIPYRRDRTIKGQPDFQDSVTLAATRNSKLTQVLKDSLGDDSKTLMLVHVSPKEEDLCETICSLNFATRVKNTRLPNEDTIEVQKQKEVAIANLQQKIQEIEHKQLHVKKEIVILEKRLENLTGTSLFSKEQDETEEQLKNRTSGDTTVASMSKFPSFMRPTVSSRKKSDTIYQSSECKVPVPRRRRRRRATSHRAESVTLPVKDYSDYNSEHSISRSSCFVTLNKRISADNATVHSQETSESDVKLPKKEKTTSDHIERQLDTTDYKQNSRVDNWFDLQKNGTNTNGYNHGTKRIIAIPLPKKKYMQIETREAQKKFDENAYSFCDLKIQEVVNNDENDQSVTAGGLGRSSSSEEETHKRLIGLNDSINGDLRCNFIPASQTTEGKRTADYTGDSSLDDTGWNISSTEHNEYNYHDEVHAFSADEGEKQMSDICQLNNQVFCELLHPDLDGSITWSKEDSGCSISMSKGLCHLQEHNETVAENAKGKDADFSISPLLIEERTHNMLHLRSRKSLFTNSSNQKLQAEKNYAGICHFLKEKLEVLLASALLGLGLCSLGYEHEFFYGLEL